VLETKRTSTVYSAQNRTLAVCCEQISLAYLGKDTKDTINTHGSLYGCTWVEPHLVPRASRGCRRRHAQAAGKAAVHEHTFPTAMSGSSQGLATSCMDSSAMDSDSSTLHIIATATDRQPAEACTAPPGGAAPCTPWTRTAY
jgi:hypothetical protein